MKLLLKRLLGLSTTKKKKKNNYFDESIEYRLTRVEKLVGTKIKNKYLYLEALTHRSGINLSPLKKSISNERLEFLGDSVLNLIVTEYIFSKFKEESEGQMTNLRSRFVNKEILLEVANRIKISKILFVNENAAIAIESGAKSILADSVEALIGAIYLDLGFDHAKKFIYQYIVKPNIHLKNLKDKNYKSQLLEFVQSRKISNPKYEVIKEEGPQHLKIFVVQVSIDGIPLGTGSGQTKRAAEQIAAKHALDKIKKSTIFH